MPLPLEMVVDGPAVSQQTRRKARVKAWTQQVENAAKGQWNLGPPYGGEVRVAITYFFDPTPMDVDNIPKPVLDALKGLVYADDAQVTDVLCRKRNRSEDLRIQNPSQILRARLRGQGQFLHIVVDGAMSREVTQW